MSLNLRKWETTHSGVRRIAGVIAESAERYIGRPGPTQVEDLHEVRLCIKRMRALWRLLRPSISEKVFEQENSRLREVSMQLSKFRDDDVIYATLQALEEKVSVKKLQNALRDLKCEFMPDEDRSQDIKSKLRSAAEALRKSSNVLRGLTIKNRGWRIFSLGLSLSCNRARKCFHRAGQHADDEIFHEWRKRVKDLIYQLEIILPIRPRILSPQHRKSKDLAALLGEYHDFTVICQRIDVLQDRNNVQKFFEPARAYFIREMDGLRDATLSCGNYLPIMKDQMWIERLHQHWMQWRRNRNKKEQDCSVNA